jgi:pimeloyl-ACP methyl ester carboxylesterase
MGGGWSTYWSQVAPAVAGATRVCTYDRGGLGWSDPGPTPRTGQRLADELHVLLERSGERGPFVLVGHSLSGFVVRLYQNRYPADVVGLVLVDVAHEDAMKEPAFRAYDAQLKRQLRSTRVMVPLGGVRLSLAIGAPESTRRMLDLLRGLPPKEREFVIAEWSSPRYWARQGDEVEAREQTIEEVRRTAAPEGLPLVVVTCTGPEFMPGVPPIAGFGETWLRMQHSLLALSPRSRQILADGSSHFVQFEQPQVVVQAVLQAIEAERAKAPGGRLPPVDPRTRVGLETG